MSIALQLKEFSFFAELGDEDRELVADLVETVEVRSGRRLFRAGGEADGMALLVEGQVELTSPRTDDVGIMTAGSSFGTASLVTVVKHEATARALTSCTLLFLERTRFRRLVDDYPRTACRLLESLFAEFAVNTRAALDEISPSGE